MRGLTPRRARALRRSAHAGRQLEADLRQAAANRLVACGQGGGSGVCDGEREAVGEADVQAAVRPPIPYQTIAQLAANEAKSIPNRLCRSLRAVWV